MQKRIFFNFVGLVLICVVLLVVSFSLLFYRAAQTHEKAAIRDKAHLVAELLDQTTYSTYETIDGGDTRITIISPDGRTLSDSHIGADLNINRSNREEFIQAVHYGVGEAIRASATLGAETFYYAVRLQSGDVLRLSRTLYSLGEVFTSTLPAHIAITFLVLLISYFIANRLTRLIIKPIVKINFAGTDTTTEPGELFYEELWPYIKKIDRQKREITSQINALKNRTETIEAIISNMREGIVLLDEVGVVLAANQSVFDIFGISKKHEILHKNIGYIYRAPKFIQAVKSCLNGEYMDINFTIKSRFYNAYLSPASSGAIIFFLDTTDKHKAEKHRREFTANVSHELKTPLTTISALSEIMGNGIAEAKDVAEFSQKISGHTNRLISVIDDIIRLSEFDESKVERDFTTFNIYELAKSVIDSLHDKAAEKMITVKLTGKPIQIKANSRRIDELIYNLIDNGIKYNKDNGKVTLDIDEENGWCKISVSDTGIGIPKKHHDRVFERFYRVDTSRSKKTGGTGLGLSIVKHITEHHNGRIVLESTEGAGTTIICRIAVEPYIK